MLVMRTILSLALAAFALAIPVAQPHAVGDLSSVGTSCLSQYALCTSLIDSTSVSGLIGRRSTIGETEVGLNNIFGDFLVPSVASGSLDESILAFLSGEIEGIVQDSLEETTGNDGFDASYTQDIIQEIDGNIHHLLLNAVNAGNVTQDVVDRLVIAINDFVAPVLEAGVDDS